ncbi:Aste57867_18558 [Aphanomyces stellatus]|uniref:Aste57867_18558 protein n=1 Tax=Aphanomyces stellatus TaxID=120398 RepID=A0A485LB97_9STRA|nr:hypothetical protein As57867_018496 [Aphanomyces stellatus]VFT95294.1 Aste57867_18558 [Aphanomyces stellatus]
MDLDAKKQYYKVNRTRILERRKELRAERRRMEQGGAKAAAKDRRTSTTKIAKRGKTKKTVADEVVTPTEAEEVDDDVVENWRMRLAALKAREADADIDMLLHRQNGVLWKDQPMYNPWKQLIQVDV